ncbi:MAG: HRDC domain-containing protein, partial [Acidimicrobiales bacterium]
AGEHATRGGGRTRDGRGERSGGRGAGDRRRTAEPRVPAAVGLVVEQGGQAGEIVDLRPDGAVLQVGSARLVVPFGTRVLVDGRTAVLAAPAAPEAAVQAAEEALRGWRREVAAAEKVPAYIVFNDRELAGIARALPRTLAGLAACPGVGPIKLERWGDEVLALLESVPAGAGGVAGVADGATGAP